jgi:hypothetical protein
MIATEAARAATAIEAIENFFINNSSQGGGGRNSCVLLPGQAKKYLNLAEIGSFGDNDVIKIYRVFCSFYSPF